MLLQIFGFPCLISRQFASKLNASKNLFEHNRRRLYKMGKPKHNLLATARETLTPPTTLDNGNMIAEVIKGEGNNLWSVKVPGSEGFILVELPARFRSAIWLKRGGYVVVDTTAFDNRENKLRGEIINVVRDEKLWRKQIYWCVPRGIPETSSSSYCRPNEFKKKPTYLEESEDDESTVGKMPPADVSD